MNEYGTKVRLLRIMLAILESPKGYTANRLAEIYTPESKSSSTIRRDIEALTNAGFVIDSDERHRYFFVENKPFKKLKDLLHFSEEEQQILHQSIDQIDIHQERGVRLKKKLASLYDYRRLGHAYLRKPYLNKVDALQTGKDEKLQVTLVGYRSYSRVADRLVEPFHVSPPDDTLQALDVESGKIRNYRISRIKKVALTYKPWQFQGHHNIMRTDPFRIVENDQVMVHLKIGLGAYNELVERFPMTRAYIEETEIANIFDFQCMVNYNFKGLTNFILGFHHERIEVLEPESLLNHLRERIDEMNF